MNKLRYILPYWKLITLVVLFVVIRIVTLQHDALPSWDAAVYIGMGKYLFSHGSIGTWEALRPVGLPIMLGAFWKIGIDPYVAGQVISLIISAGLLVLVYFFTERIRPHSGTIAATVLAATAVFFTNSALPITDIISTFFAVLALFLIYKAQTTRQYFIAGIVIAIACMFRFPQGLMLVIAMVAIAIKIFYEPTLLKFKKGKLGERVVTAIERMFSVGGGFFLIVVPFLIGNYYFYNNAFLPFIQGAAIIKLYPSLYQKGPLFYVLEVVKADPLFVLGLLPIGLLWKKEYRTKGIFIVITAIVFIAGYFTYQVHKESRYMVAFLPYIAMLTACGVTYILEYVKLPQLLFFGLFAIAGFMVTAGLLFHTTTPDNKAFHDFNKYFNKTEGAHILSATPFPFVYANVFLEHDLYSDWNNAYYEYNTLKNQIDYIALDSCNLEQGCADNTHCTDDKEVLLATLRKNDMEVFSATTPAQCQLSIYKITH
ncbi:MAG: glycosyltransferase family 39 protein [Candidatus Paceibacterota bacterium]